MSDLLRLLKSASPPVEEAALLIAADAYPGLDVAAYLGKLDEMAAPLLPLASGGGPRLRDALVEQVYATLGFSGNEAAYYDPCNSYLNDVIDRRKGIPITLAVVLIALGRRVGLQVDGIGFPGHFLVRVGGPDGDYLDPFNEGRVLKRVDLFQLAQRFLGDQHQLVESQLQPAKIDVMVVRMLFNLQKIYERRGDHARALLACDRLVDISDAPFHRRDRGMHALALGAEEAAVEDLDRYLELAPGAEDAASVLGVLQRAGARDTSLSLN